MRYKNVQDAIMREAIKEGSAGVSMETLKTTLRMSARTIGRALDRLTASDRLVSVLPGIFEPNPDARRGADGTPMLAGTWVFPDGKSKEVVDDPRAGRVSGACHLGVRVAFPGGADKPSVVKDMKSGDLRMASRAERARAEAFARHTPGWADVRSGRPGVYGSKENARKTRPAGRAPEAKPEEAAPPGPPVFVVVKIHSPEQSLLEDARAEARRLAKEHVGEQYAVMRIQEVWRSSIVVDSVAFRGAQ